MEITLTYVEIDVLARTADALADAAWTVNHEDRLLLCVLHQILRRPPTVPEQQQVYRPHEWSR